MKIWIAGNTGVSDREVMAQRTKPARLMSFHYIILELFGCREMYALTIRRKMKDKKVDLFLDSGAFSAMTQGVVIDLKEYIKFIKEHEEHLEVYANLDVIGDADATWRNQQQMEKAGLSPLPCFHFGEDIKHLQRYLKNYEYIALGGMVGWPSGQLSQWLDEMYTKYICGEDGLPRVKVHGFGLTSFKLMCRYPWYSVDSTSWVVTGRMGAVMVPKPWQGVLGEVWKVTVSSRSPSKSDAGQHIDTFPPTQRKAVLTYFKAQGYALGHSDFRPEKAGYVLKDGERNTDKIKKGVLAVDQDVEVIVEPGLCNDYKLRDELNIKYYVMLEKALPKWPWAFKLKTRKGGFGL